MPAARASNNHANIARSTGYSAPLCPVNLRMTNAPKYHNQNGRIGQSHTNLVVDKSADLAVNCPMPFGSVSG
jgi:hypothetical protein